MLTHCLRPVTFIIVVFTAVACNGTLSSSGSLKTPTNPISKSLPPAVIVNSQLGPHDEPAIKINSEGQFQLTHSAVTNAPTLQYDGVSD